MEQAKPRKQKTLPNRTDMNPLIAAGSTTADRANSASVHNGRFEMVEEVRFL